MATATIDDELWKLVEPLLGSESVASTIRAGSGSMTVAPFRASATNAKPRSGSLP